MAGRRMSGPQAELVSKWHHDKLTCPSRLTACPTRFLTALPEADALRKGKSWWQYHIPEMIIIIKNNLDCFFYKWNENLLFNCSFNTFVLYIISTRNKIVKYVNTFVIIHFISLQYFRLLATWYHVHITSNIEAYPQ